MNKCGYVIDHDQGGLVVGAVSNGSAEGLEQHNKRFIEHPLELERRKSYVYEGETFRLIPDKPSALHKWNGIEWIAPVIVETVQDLRHAAYPSVNDQLDMLWHAMDANPKLRLEPFYGTIKAVKETYPKEAGDGG